MTHADLPGGWRSLRLQAAVRGDTPVDLALHNVGYRPGPQRDKARQDLTDAIAAYEAKDIGTALAVAISLAEELKQAKPGRGAAA